jgi:ATP adenylyltransferase
MAEFQDNLWAPWRMEYIAGLTESEPEGCFLCRYFATPAADRENHVLWRTARTLVLLNRYPYTSGHLLVAPATHVPMLDQLSDEMLIELTVRLRDAARVLTEAMRPQGLNIGMNLGRCAGAGLPDHLHWHIVPRWSGDTNFMPVIGDVRVIPESIAQTADRFRAAAAKLGL